MQKTLHSFLPWPSAAPWGDLPLLLGTGRILGAWGVPEVPGLVLLASEHMDLAFPGVLPGQTDSSPVKVGPELPQLPRLPKLNLGALCLCFSFLHFLLGLLPLLLASFKW